MKPGTVNPLWLQDVEIRHFAGVQSENAFHIRDLSPGINLIYGPNGCGKSTTAKAIRQLLWPDPRSEYSELRARVRHADRDWTLTSRGKEVKWLDEGVLKDPPAWSPPESRQQYHWSLQNLLQAMDGDLARQISREMAGGIDFEELAAALGWKNVPPSPQGLHTQFVNAEKKLRERRNEQQKLKQDSLQLKDLERKRRRELEKAGRAPLLKLALELTDKKEQLAACREELSEFPEGMASLRGDDGEVLENLLANLNGRRNGLARLKREREELGTGEESWATVSAADLQQAAELMEQELDQVREREREYEQARKEFEELESAQQQKHQAIGIHARAALDLAEGFTYPEIHAWIRLVFRQLTLRERKRILVEAVGDTGETAGEESCEAEELREARRCLEDWLRTNTPPKPASLAGLISGSLILLGVLIYGIRLQNLHPALLLLLLPAPLLQALFQKKMDGMRSEEIRSRYPQAVPGPENWEAEAVRNHLPVLDGALRRSHREDLRRTDRKRLSDLEAELMAVDADVVSLRTQLTETGLDLQADPEWLAHFLHTVQAWREIREKTRSAETLLADGEEKRDRATAQLRRSLEQWGVRESALPLPAAVKSLSERIRNELHRREQRAHLELEIKHLRTQEQDRLSEMRQLCKRTAVAEGDLHTLKSRLESLDRWQTRSRRGKSLQDRIAELEEELGPARTDLPKERSALQEELAQCEVSAAEERRLQKQIHQLEQRIEDQSSGQSLHEAEEALESCRQELAEARERQLQIQTGSCLLDWLQEQCRDRDRSVVLKEANRYLGLFSKGNLQLHLSGNKNREAFSASFPGRPPQSLDRLSSGERTQVLMAVRLAFVTLNEQTALPLLVDEALGISDDQRGGELIRSLIEISRQGRQLFYFTAQEDEVQKWRAALAEQHIGHRLIDLEALREKTDASPLPEILHAPPGAHDFTRREEESLSQWAERLNIPGWHPQRGVEELSLWYLLNEREGLLQALFLRGIRTAGQWQVYGGAGSLDGWMNPRDRETVARSIRVFGELTEAWRIGRPPPVPVEILLGSRAVSSTFSGAVEELLQKVNGSAASLLEGLKNREVPRFSRQKTGDLEEELLEKGYLSHLEPLTEDEIKARVLSRFPELDPAEWDGLCRRFFSFA